MNLGLARDILSQNTERLISGADYDEAYLVAHPIVRAELESLFEVVQRIREHLIVPEPSTDFQNDLRMRLVSAAHRRAEERARSAREPHHPTHRREIIFGVAALGSLVSVAIVVVASRSRWHSRSRPTVSAA